jgi:type I restriction enzyme S subunit
MTMRKICLRRIFKIINGGTPESDEKYWNGSVPWATPIDVGSVDGKYLESTQRSLTRLGVLTGSRTIPGNSLILSTRAPIGYIAQTTGQTAFNQGCRGLVAIIPADIRYFRYQLYALRDKLVATGTGSTFMELSTDSLAAIPMTCPSLNEQHRIADFLDRETSRIATLINAIYAESSLLHFKRLSLLASAFQNDGLKRARIGYYLELVTSGPRGWSEYVGSHGTPFFRSANIRRDEIEPNLEELALVDLPRSAAAEAMRSRIRVGDVLVGITGANTGWVSLADERIAQANVSQHVCLVRPGKAIDGRWLAYALSAPQIQKLLLGSQYGGTKTQLSLSNIRDLTLPLPPLGTQKRFSAAISERLATITTARALRDRQLALLTERHQALITSVVTGHIDVATARGVAT